MLHMLQVLAIEMNTLQGSNDSVSDNISSQKGYIIQYRILIILISYGWIIDYFDRIPSRLVCLAES